jgi:hypothetical protein
MKRLFVILFFLLPELQIYAQQAHIHPRGMIIAQKEVIEIREKSKHEPFKSWSDIMRSTTLAAEKEIE